MDPLYQSKVDTATPSPLSRRLLAACQRFPRSLFPAAAALPPDAGELEAFPEDLVPRLLQALELSGTERVLEVGSRTAYLTALLSHLAGKVYSVAADRQLADERARDLGALGCGNVQVVQADAATGWPPGGPYQAIVVGAGAPEVPRELLDQLDVGGRLIIPIGDESAQMLSCMHKRQDAVSSETLGACRMKMLAGTPASPSSYPWTRQSEA